MSSNFILGTINKEDAVQMLADVDSLMYSDMIEKLYSTHYPSWVKESLQTYSILDSENITRGLFITHKRECDKDIIQLNMAIFGSDIEVSELTTLLLSTGLGTEYYIFGYGCEITGTSDTLCVEGPSVQFYHKRTDAKLSNRAETTLIKHEHKDKLPGNSPSYVKHYWDMAIELPKQIFGYCTVIDGEVVSFCVSAPFAHNIAGTEVREIMSVYTDFRYRKSGLGKTVLTEVTKAIKEHGEIPRYTAAPDDGLMNMASIALAKSVGYEETVRISAYQLHI